MSAILCHCDHLQQEIQKVKLIIIQVQSFGGFCMATMKRNMQIGNILFVFGIQIDNPFYENCGRYSVEI